MHTVSRRLLLLALALAGCDALTLTPADGPVTDVDPTAVPLVIDLAATDTVSLWDARRVDLTLQGGNERWLQMYLDDVLVAEGSGAPPLSISTAGFADGPYTLRIRVEASAATGSLADALGRERVEAEVERVAIIDNAPPDPRPITGVSRRGGLLTLEWDTYRRVHFQAYQVYGRYGPRGGEEPRSYSSRRTSPEWSDTQYLGGPAFYRVLVLAGDKSAWGGGVAVDYPIPTLVETDRTADGGTLVAWRGTLFPGAFEEYRLIREGASNGLPSPEVIARNTDAADTTAVDDRAGAFGQATWYTLETAARRGGRVVRDRALHYDDPASPFEGAVVGVPALGALLGLDGEGRPSLHDAATLKQRAVATFPLRFVPLALAASPSGRLAIVETGSRVAYEVDPATLGVLRTVEIPSTAQGRLDRDPSARTFLSDDGILTIGFERESGPHAPGEVPAALVSIDLGSGDVVGQFEQGVGETTRRPVALSSDGRYLVAGTPNRLVLYERAATEETGYRRLTGLASTVRDAQFVGPERLAVIEDVEGQPLTEAAVLDVPSLDRSLTLGSALALAELRVDGAAGHALVLDVEGQVIRIYEVDTGRLVADFPAEVAATPSSVAEPGLSLAAGAVWNRGRYRRYE